MQTPSKRDWRVPTDRLQPKTRANVRLTRRGIGGVYALLGNPISITVDPILGCLPWISLRGGTDPASNAVRDQITAAPNLQASGDQADYSNNPYTLEETPRSGSSGGSSGSSGGSSGRSFGGLFNTIRKVDSSR